MKVMGKSGPGRGICKRKGLKVVMSISEELKEVRDAARWCVQGRMVRTEVREGSRRHPAW